MPVSPAPHNGNIQGTGTIWNRVPSDLTGTIASSRTIQPLSNRHCWGPPTVAIEFMWLVSWTMQFFVLIGSWNWWLVVNHARYHATTDGGGLVESHGSKWLNTGPRGNGGFCPATELILVETKLISVSVGGSLGYIEVDYGGAASPRSCLFYVTGWRHFWDRSYLCSG